MWGHTLTAQEMGKRRKAWDKTTPENFSTWRPNERAKSSAHLPGFIVSSEPQTELHHGLYPKRLIQWYTTPTDLFTRLARKRRFLLSFWSDRFLICATATRWILGRPQELAIGKSRCFFNARDRGHIGWLCLSVSTSPRLAGRSVLVWCSGDVT